MKLRLSAAHETWMMMSGIVALCALVVVGVLIIPLFGPRVAAMTAVIVVGAIVLFCYLICMPRAFARIALHGNRGGTDRDH